MYQRVMVPLDGSSFGEHAIPFALEIARRSSARLDLVHVHVHPSDEDLSAITPYQFENVTRRYRERDDDELRHEQAQIATLAARLADQTGLQVTGRILSGAVVEALRDDDRRFHADLTVMATHARTGLDRTRLGSVADLVVRHVEHPVLLIQPPAVPEVPFRRIMVALDGSPFAEQALEPATRFARLYEGELLLVHVDDQWVSPLTDYMSDMARRLPDATVEVTRAIHAVDGLLSIAGRWNADLVVMATHGHGGLRRALVGSTASDLVARTHLPVLLQRPLTATTTHAPGAQHATVR